jgi:hypothetical protein
MIRQYMLVLVVVLLPLAASGALAASGKAKAPTAAERAAAWEKAAAPGEHHQLLEQMAGEFDVTVKYWAMPDEPVAESKGTCTNEMILGGRYLQQTYKGAFRGGTIEGKGIIGYDNVGQKFMQMWIDSASTDVLLTEGPAQPGKKVIAGTGAFTDTWTGQKGKLRTVTTLVDAKTIRYELFKPRGGKEARVLEITYSRK